MKTKLFLMFAIAMFMICLASAEVQTLGTFKQSSCINLKQICANCTYVNLTSVMYPDSTLALSTSSAMTKSGTEYNYTFCSTSQTGEYIASGIANPDGIIDTWTFNLYVTPSGVVQNSIWNNPLPLILIAIALILTILAFYNNNKPMGFLAGIIFVIAGMYIMIYGFNDYADMYTRIAGYVLMGIGFVFLLAAGYEMMNDLGEAQPVNNEEED